MPHAHVILHAFKPALNVNRFYTIYLGQGLFNSWVVMVGYGRHNRKGRQKSYAFLSLDEAKRFLKKTLHKRLKAEKRIGCNYDIIQQKVFDD